MVALRCAFAGLFVVAVGLVITVWNDGAGLTVLAVGMLAYLVSIVITFVAFLSVYFSYERPRPPFLGLRWKLIRDTVRGMR